MRCRFFIKINYNNKSIKCAKLGINILGTEKEIIDKINSLIDEKRNCLMDYTNICIVIRRHVNMSCNDLIDYRNTKAKENRIKQT